MRSLSLRSLAPLIPLARAVEPGKGRKCVILVGRPREVFKMSWNELRRAGGLGDVEFWTKLSPEGMVLSSTASVQTVLGFLPTEMGEWGGVGDERSGG